MVIEHPLICPWCGEPVTMLLELCEPRQEYVEDCEVCCHPILVDYAAEQGRLVRFSARRAQ